MSSLIYHVVRSVEKVSVRCGWGIFELGSDAWKCLDCCHHQPHSEDRDGEDDLCPRCRRAWVREVGHIEYSDAFERRMNIAIGSAGLGTGFAAWAGSVRWGWWERGVAFDSISKSLPNLPTLLPQPLTSALLLLTLASSILALVGGYAITLFLMLSNPTGKRHWRHMTAPMYLVVAVPLAVYVVFAMWGVTVAEVGCVLAPVSIGVVSFLAVLFMRSRDEEGRVRLRFGDEGGKLREV